MQGMWEIQKRYRDH